MRAFERLTFSIAGHSVSKMIRVGQRVHSDGSPFTTEEERAQTWKEIAFKAREAGKDIVHWMYP